MGDALVDGLVEGLGVGLAVGLSSEVGEGSASGVALGLSVADSDDDGSEAGDSTEGVGSDSSSRDPVRASNVSSAEGVVVGSVGVSESAGSADSLTSGDADSSCDSSDVGDGETEVGAELDALGDGDDGLDDDGDGDCDIDGDGDAVGDGDVVASLRMHRAGIAAGMLHSDASDSSALDLSSDCVCAASSDGCNSSAHALGIAVSRRAKAANAVTMMRARERTRAESKDGSAVITVVTSPLDQASPAARSTWSPGGLAP